MYDARVLVLLRCACLRLVSRVLWVLVRVAEKRLVCLDSWLEDDDVCRRLLSVVCVPLGSLCGLWSLGREGNARGLCCDEVIKLPEGSKVTITND